MLEDGRRKAVEKQLQSAREKLLDLSMRNQLLNYRPSDARSVNIVDCVPAKLFDVLVTNGKSLKLKAIDTSPRENSDKPEATAQRPENQALSVLGVPLDDTSLASRLTIMNYRARTVMEEQGYSVLYLALGFLEWTESGDPAPALAPLVLVPVELERNRQGRTFKVKWTGEEIFTNVSLKAKIAERGVVLPDFEMPDDRGDVTGYFTAVAGAISSMPEWRVRDEIYLDFFSFTKFIMFRDLSPELWPEGWSPADHPLIEAILDPGREKKTPQEAGEDEGGQKAPSEQAYHVVDADSSQIAVIEDVKSGMNLVVEGPPGSGKSQTIVNLIAELMAAGKTVLFVSEKMAALEVVKHRLDDVGLGDFCLEIHSRKSNKKGVLDELQRVISSRPDDPPVPDDAYEHLRSLRSQLDDYAVALRSPYGTAGFSPFQLFGMKEQANGHFKKAEREMLRVKLEGVGQWTKEEFNRSIKALDDFTNVYASVRPVHTFPWANCEPGLIMPADELEIRDSIRACSGSFDGRRASMENLSKLAGAGAPATLQELDAVSDAVRLVLEVQEVEKELLTADWGATNDRRAELIGALGQYRSCLENIADTFKADAINVDAAHILEEYRAQSAHLLKSLRPGYSNIKREAAGLYKIKSELSDEAIVSDLARLVECIRLRDGIRSRSAEGKGLFGARWLDEASDPEALEQFEKQVLAIKEWIARGILGEPAIDALADPAKLKALKAALEAATVSAKEFTERESALLKKLNSEHEAVFGKPLALTGFSDIGKKLATWEKNIDKLRIWSGFISLRNDCVKNHLSPMVRLAQDNAIEPEDMVPCLRGNFADELLARIFSEQPCLAKFSGSLHQQKIDEFARADREMITLNRLRLRHKLYAGQPSILDGASSGSEAGILLYEFNRKRGHRPIRKLMTDAGGLIQKIKPCFLMSPLSVAQFLDPRSVSFDVLVFDEASQVRPEDALGALLRCKQVVVMGDTRQLPPTSFFDHLMTWEKAGEDEDTLSDIESILHQCKRCFPVKMLKWHYRSRHESLIAVSNQEFYGNRLVIYPSPVDRSDAMGLKFVHLPDTIYHRGKNSKNPGEAKAVVEAALEFYREHPDKSLGIGTFNISQQEAILDELDALLKQHPEMEEYFKPERHEHFFVKNLETIQGDERDVILISVGFGRDDNGKLYMNFGPLNQEGGERRLNVLITRAREQCIVFSNFRAGDMDVDEQSPHGLRALKAFLEYAETRGLRPIRAPAGASGSPLEESVYAFLRDNGYEVKKQIGCASYRIDMAVVDPSEPGRYLAGIECDGAPYHTSTVTRDRDRLRQQVLEGLGWKIYRIWSTDWYRDQKHTGHKLLEELQRLKSVSPLKPKAPAPKAPLIKKEAAKPSAGEKTGATTGDGVLPYAMCTSLGVQPVDKIPDLPKYTLAGAVITIVDAEAPIHIDEAIKRLCSLWGQERVTKKISAAVLEAIDLAVLDGKIRRNGEFLWTSSDRPVRVRDHHGLSFKIEHISPEEIAEAILLILKRQYATGRSDLIAATSRALGFRKAGEHLEEHVGSVVGNMLQDGRIRETQNGKVDLK